MQYFELLWVTCGYAKVDKTLYLYICFEIVGIRNVMRKGLLNKENNQVGFPTVLLNLTTEKKEKKRA